MSHSASSQPSPVGRTLWPQAQGYLLLDGVGTDDRAGLPCTCQPACLRKDCHGHCGCEACALAWMVRDDARALWDEQGNLVAPEHIDGPWRRIRNPDQLRLRFRHHLPEPPHG